MNYQLINLGLGNIRTKLAETLYFKLRIDVTRPVQIYGFVNNNCNARCKMCDTWRSKENIELPVSVWMKALKSLKSFVGTYHINFSGGEALLRNDFIEILQGCKKEGILVGFTTNGLLLNESTAQKVLDSEPFNINISIDSMDEKIHDDLRGISGLLGRVKENIDYLVAYKKEIKSHTKIILKPIVCNRNLEDVYRIVDFAREKQLNGVNFQPIFKWSQESQELFHVNKESLSNLIDKLIKMKRNGDPILNSETEIRQWIHHFEESIPKRTTPCAVSLRHMTIKSNGDIYLCGFLESVIGNINDGSIKDIWYSSKAKKVRGNLVKCKKLCTATCVVKRSWKDYLQLFFKLLKK